MKTRKHLYLDKKTIKMGKVRSIEKDFPSFSAYIEDLIKKDYGMIT